MIMFAAALSAATVSDAASALSEAASFASAVSAGTGGGGVGGSGPTGNAIGNSPYMTALNSALSSQLTHAPRPLRMSTG